MYDAMHIQTHNNDKSISNTHYLQGLQIHTLYDLFSPAHDDEAEHVRATAHLQTYGVISNPKRKKNDVTESTTITSTTTNNNEGEHLKDIT